ncbi:MAG: hypothetical protein U9O94_06890, partial [Nanoarchaeota archaeon]|nr:hypothetical protein [Nanoarchaeota archaeon]
LLDCAAVDYNNDSSVNIADVIQLMTNSKKDINNPDYDLNGDGTYSVIDVIYFIQHMEECVGYTGEAIPEVTTCQDAMECLSYNIGSCQDNDLCTWYNERCFMDPVACEQFNNEECSKCDICLWSDTDSKCSPTCKSLDILDCQSYTSSECDRCDLCGWHETGGCCPEGYGWTSRRGCYAPETRQTLNCVDFDFNKDWVVTLADVNYLAENELDYDGNERYSWWLDTIRFLFELPSIQSDCTWNDDSILSQALAEADIDKCNEINDEEKKNYCYQVTIPGNFYAKGKRVADLQTACANNLNGYDEEICKVRVGVFGGSIGSTSELKYQINQNPKIMERPISYHLMYAEGVFLQNLVNNIRIEGNKVYFIHTQSTKFGFKYIPDENGVVKTRKIPLVDAYLYSLDSENLDAGSTLITGVDILSDAHRGSGLSTIAGMPIKSIKDIDSYGDYIFIARPYVPEDSYVFDYIEVINKQNPGQRTRLRLASSRYSLDDVKLIETDSNGDLFIVNGNDIIKIPNNSYNGGDIALSHTGIKSRIENIHDISVSEDKILVLTSNKIIIMDKSGNTKKEYSHSLNNLVGIDSDDNGHIYVGYGDYILVFSSNLYRFAYLRSVGLMDFDIKGNDIFVLSSYSVEGTSKHTWWVDFKDWVDERTYPTVSSFLEVKQYSGSFSLT